MMKCMPIQWKEIRHVYDDEGYSLESFNRIHGSGFDFKFGAIFRPIEDSPLRIGLAVHTPIYYKLTYTTGALLTSDLYLPDDAGNETSYSYNCRYLFCIGR